MDMQTQLPEALHSIKALVIDDDKLARDFITYLLRKFGIRDVVHASDGNEALTMLVQAAEPIELVVCDLNMPGMDGIEFFRHLAEHHFAGGVILASGSDARTCKTVETLIDAHHLHFLGSVEKPIDVSTLFVLLNKLTIVAPAASANFPFQLLTPEEIRIGLDTNQVDVFFQPKVSVLDRRVLGAECLVRWHHPERGLLPPAAFISVAEEYGLIDALTLEVFRQAMARLGDWTRKGHHLKVAVNLSMDNLSQLDLPEVFMKIVKEAGVDVSNVILEITESRLTCEYTKSLETITRLRLKGFGLSIDDFGTGHSSLEKLKLLPFTELKVDRAFVFGAAKDPIARAIFESSVHLARALSMNIVAEGAETQEDWDLVTQLGCNEVQGYFIAKPMSATDLMAWIEKNDAQKSACNTGFQATILSQ